MGISRKSGSMVALLLMVAVLATTASAEVTIFNRCNSRANLTTGSAQVSIQANSNTTVDGSMKTFLTPPVSVAVNNQTAWFGQFPLPVAVLLTKPSAGTGDRIDIRCSSIPNCVTLTLTVNFRILFFITFTEVKTISSTACPT